ncbi:hypothetical protein [Pontibacter sp. SGAir0037]|uniref:hypothetical protein n=1 Tax=Pontibacter sp. SGAir0037 TaxID=2571030 RepID=UPI0010F67A70|nr:hypothetical protein [Pontibacter sp. SGAir0037]
MAKEMIKTIGEAIPIHRLLWMEEFQFTETGPICQKTGLIKNGEEIGYINANSNIEYAAPDTMVLPVKIHIKN